MTETTKDRGEEKVICDKCNGTGEGELPIPLQGAPEDNDLIPDECEKCDGTGGLPA